MRILVTGSAAEGLGRLAAATLGEVGHEVVAQVRSEARIRAMRELTDLGAELAGSNLGRRIAGKPDLPH